MKGTGALGGIKVLDLTRVLAGPYCTMILADLGAEVIKVEAPGGSDETRGWGPPFRNGVSAYYLCANRNKRSITVNLKTEEGRNIIRALVKEADVVIHNFKTGSMEKWELDYDSLKPINPRIVYCSITGFGETGPDRHLPGYDYMIQGMSGLMSITGSEESGPMKIGVAMVDILTGLYAAIAIEAALLEREKSHQGQKIDMSLLDTAVSSLANVASNYLISGEVPRRLGNHHPNIAPYSTFKALDGELIIAVGNDRQFAALCEVLGVRELAHEERFHTNESRVKYKQQLTAILETQLQVKTVNEWLDLFSRHNIPSGPIATIDQVVEHPQVVAREMIVPVEHPQAGLVKLIGSPIKLSRTKVNIERHPPVAGEHTDEILLEVGFSQEKINELKDNTII
ncbi:CaiB/BaiF CoA transferase family protein [Bacillus rubiinfantis]|uniref:CaiB/BaiF CoA transferase family protein n=1 Tax=Bacillus rubiinfantis TaxID=1499680 RepID=UPI0005A80AB9|nr:CaiB/BaiF CoA-transferase family protein [Bacillus rubiinfantis]